MSSMVLITGGAGFIGTHTAALLMAEGYRVRVLDNLIPQVHPSDECPLQLPEEIQFVRGDIRDRNVVEAALTGVDAVLHLAALTGVTQSMHAVDAYVDVNVRGTATLWDAIVNGSARPVKFVLASSRAVYGEGAFRCDCRQGSIYPQPRPLQQLEQGRWDPECPFCGAPLVPLPTAEDAPLAPLSVYALTKMFQERLSVQMAELAGTGLVILRYFNVYGPFQSLSNPYTGIAPAFCSRAREGKPIRLFEDGRPIRDFIHVQDVARANLLALQRKPEVPEIFNIGTGVQLTIADIAEAIAHAIGSRGQFEYSGQYRLGDIRSCYADVTRAARDLRFTAQVSLRDGIADLVDWVIRQEKTMSSFDAAMDDLAKRGLIATARA